jgi:hypothetical protein
MHDYAEIIFVDWIVVAMLYVERKMVVKTLWSCADG